MTRRRMNHRCEDCGAAIYKVKRPDKPLICMACAMIRATVAASQMRDHSGPAWDKWLASNARKGPPPAP